MSDPSNQLQQWVTFTLHGSGYVVPINQVLEVMTVDTITPVPQSPDYMAGVINVRGQVIPVLDLAKRFQLDNSAEAAGKYIILVTDPAKDANTGMLVDEVTSISKYSSDQLQSVPITYQNQPIAPFLQGVFVDDSSDKLKLAIDLTSVMSTTDTAITRPADASSTTPSTQIISPVSNLPVVSTSTESSAL